MTHASTALFVQLKKLREQAIIPAYQTAGAAGFDLHACVHRDDEKFGPITAIEIAPGSIGVISTGISVSNNNPEWGLFLFGRSGLGKKGIRLANSVGVIDSDYQGELIVLLRNDSDKTFTVAHGDRIAQGVFMPVIQARFMEVTEFSAKTERGDRGFGSTGGTA